MIALSNVTSNVTVVCPFFIHDARQSISCEGNLGHTICMHKFQSPEEKNQHISLYCENPDYERVCPHAGWLKYCYEETSDGNKDVMSAMRRMDKAAKTRIR